MNVTTPPFEDLLRLEAQQRGLPDLAYIVVSHPIGQLKPDAVIAKGQAAADDLLEAFVGARAVAEAKREK